jgi:hypothetical protein
LTGCAAILLDCDATTLHSFMGIGIAKGDPNKIVSFALKRKKKMTELKQIRVLVIDEVSMLSEKVVQIIENIARIIKSPHVFGKIQVVMTGDFPTAAHRDGENPTHGFFESPIWNRLFTKETILNSKPCSARKIQSTGKSYPKHGTVGSRTSYNVLKTRLDAKYDPALHNGCVPSKYSQPESTWITRTGDTTPNCVERRPCSSSPKDGRRDIRDLNTFIPYKTVMECKISRPNSGTTNLTPWSPPQISPRF